MPRTVSELQYVRLYPKRHALIFLHHPNAVQKKLQTRSLKPYYPTAQRNNYDSTYCLVQNVHFITEVIKQVPKWLSFLSTITGALGYCQMNTERDLFLTLWPTLLGRLEEQYYSKMEEKEFSKQEQEKYPDRDRCLLGWAGSGLCEWERTVAPWT